MIEITAEIRAFIDKVKGIDAEAVKFLEEAIDRMQASVKPITKFTIPGGHRVEIGRASCRERV